MNGQTLIGLATGILFGAGLAVSGMADPARVRAFLDITGNWDPTLAFVMGGAILPMALAWRILVRLARPLVAPKFDLPSALKLDARLLTGAAIFGVGWGVAGLCPGPGFAALALAPGPAIMFVIAMLVGMLVHRFWAARTGSKTSTRESQLT